MEINWNEKLEKIEEELLNLEKEHLSINSVEDQDILSQIILITELKEEYLNILIEFETMTKIHNVSTPEIDTFFDNQHKRLPWDKEFYKNFSNNEIRFLFLNHEIGNLKLIKSTYQELLAKEKTMLEREQEIRRYRDNFAKERESDESERERVRNNFESEQIKLVQQSQNEDEDSRFGYDAYLGKLVQQSQVEAEEARKYFDSNPSRKME